MSSNVYPTCALDIFRKGLSSPLGGSHDFANGCIHLFLLEINETCKMPKPLVSLCDLLVFLFPILAEKKQKGRKQQESHGLTYGKMVFFLIFFFSSFCSVFIPEAETTED